ncbi:GntR family transcriptional regulator [Roseibium sp. M-1]
MSVSSLSEALVRASDEMSGPVQLNAAASRVYSRLRTQIISMELKPDSVLTRADIAKEHDVSQSPVREAIQELEKEGLVVSYPQSKTLVTKIDVNHARETQFLRLSVELEVAKSLAGADNQDLLLPSKRVLRMQKMAGEDRDIAEFTALDRLFHLSLFQAAGVASLWHLISGRSGHIDRLRRLNLPDPGKIASVLDSHEKILDAISAGNLQDVEIHVRTHLTGTLASAKSIMALHPDYFGETDAG